MKLCGSNKGKEVGKGVKQKVWPEGQIHQRVDGPASRQGHLCAPGLSFLVGEEGTGQLTTTWLVWDPPENLV